MQHSNQNARRKITRVIVIVAALTIGPVIAFVGLRDIVPLRHPGLLELKRSQLVGRWEDEGGGFLILKDDGTLTASRSCLGSGTGTWTYPAEYTKALDGDTAIDFEVGDSLDGMETGGSTEKPVLWKYVGDPDNGDICKMERQK